MLDLYLRLSCKTYTVHLYMQVYSLTAFTASLRGIFMSEADEAAACQAELCMFKGMKPLNAVELNFPSSQNSENKLYWK